MRHRVRISAPWNLQIGANCWIGEDVRLNSAAPIIIGSDVVLSQSAQLTCPASATLPLYVQNGAWIALRARVVGPCVIGRRAVVGAAAVATSDVPAGHIVPSPNVVKVASHPDVV